MLYSEYVSLAQTKIALPRHFGLCLFSQVILYMVFVVLLVFVILRVFLFSLYSLFSLYLTGDYSRSISVLYK
jgi:hypothetical protein